MSSRDVSSLENTGGVPLAPFCEIGGEEPAETCCDFDRSGEITSGETPSAKSEEFSTDGVGSSDGGFEVSAQERCWDRAVAFSSGETVDRSVE